MVEKDSLWQFRIGGVRIISNDTIITKELHYMSSQCTECASDINVTPNNKPRDLITLSKLFPLQGNLEARVV